MNKNNIRMQNGIQQGKLFEMAQESNQDVCKLLEKGVLYIREHREIGTYTYLATSNKDWVLKLIQEANGTKPFIDNTKDLFKTFDEMVSVLQEEKEEACAYFHITNSLYGLQVKVGYLELKTVYTREIITLEKLSELHEKLAESLRRGEVVIHYNEHGYLQQVRTSHDLSVVTRWLGVSSFAEAYKVIKSFGDGYDVGMVLVPDIDSVSGKYEGVHLLDIEHVEVL